MPTAKPPFWLLVMLFFFPFPPHTLFPTLFSLFLPPSLHLLTALQCNRNTKGIIVTVFSLITYFALIFLRSRIMLAAVVIKIASRYHHLIRKKKKKKIDCNASLLSTLSAVRSLPLLLAIPILKFTLLVVLTTWFVYVMV